MVPSPSRPQGRERGVERGQEENSHRMLKTLNSKKARRRQAYCTRASHAPLGSSYRGIAWWCVAGARKGLYARANRKHTYSPLHLCDAAGASMMCVF